MGLWILGLIASPFLLLLLWFSAVNPAGVRGGDGFSSHVRAVASV